MMYRMLLISFAFVGVIVGAGFASGREALQYYTSFGSKGTIGIIIATVLYAYCGMILMKVGSRLQTVSYRDTISLLAGRYLGVLIDYIIIFTMFGLGVAMIAGAGSLLNQQFNLPLIVGNTLMTIMVIITIMLKLDRVITAVGALTPFLVIFVIILCVYSLWIKKESLITLEPYALAVKTTLPNWYISSLNHVSFNIAVGAGMALIIGGNEKNETLASTGGLIGGILLGILLLLGHLAILTQIKTVSTVDMPLLQIAVNLSPTFAYLFTIIILGMIYNTAVSMLYVFVSRFVPMESKKSKKLIIISCILAYILSFIGFKEVVAYFYPLIGYVGTFLIGVLLYAPFRLKALASRN